MGKISPVSAKYIVQASIEIEGVVERPDVIGAIFGQTEGLLGNDLELRELQRSGRIGRIDVKTDVKSGKAAGEIIIPSSLDKAETAIIAAAIETIQRIGPCNAKVKILNIEDVRVSKRNYIIERAKELLHELTEKFMPDSQELTDKVAESVRMMEVSEYGKDRLPAGPLINESEEIIVVEGRADVLNLLKHGIKNAIGLNGTSVPETIKELSGKKNIILFVDGDRGGDLIIKEVTAVAEIDFVCKAPDGKEVEEITKKEIHKALRSKVTVEQIKLEEKPQQMHQEAVSNSSSQQRNNRHLQNDYKERYQNKAQEKKQDIEKSQDFKRMLEELVGTRGAYILDGNLNILGKVPVTELATTLNSLRTGVFAVVLDGTITRDIASIAEKIKVQYLVGKDSRVDHSRISLLTQKQL
ncbi:DNA primase [Candidatus Woesearchaeota archaeon]|nr:DNA primase [Candidatus Woesearchaeota archaeon]